jgi:glycosyltransferase involved in cell wall biosynthesis
MSSHGELVSVIIPCHNYGRFLGEAIESVLNQTNKQVEVIVVDDGSTDDTESVAARYPVRYVRQANRGVCAASNLGLRVSSGQLVMRLDADDVLCPTYIEELISALDSDAGADFAYSHGAFFGAATGPFPLQPFDPETLAQGAYAVCLALTRRSALERAGGYDESMTGLRCEDWDLWLTFADLGKRGLLVPKQLWLYRRHASGSRNTWRFVSKRGIARELRLISHLQDKHPQLFACPRLLGRLVQLPRRLWNREVTPRFAVLLSIFYSVMLVRLVLGLTSAESRDGGTATVSALS